jgi:hypothetical protein
MFVLLLIEVNQILVALQEWRSGYHQPIIQVEQENRRMMEEQVKVIGGVLSRQKKEFEDEWINFSDCVRTHGLGQVYTGKKFILINF